MILITKVHACACSQGSGAVPEKSYFVGVAATHPKLLSCVGARRRGTIDIEF